MTRRTIVIDGATYCADVLGSLPGSMGIVNATLGACGGPGPVPPGRVGWVQASYPPNTVGAHRNAMQYAELLGYNAVNGLLMPAPGASGASPLFRLAAGQYLALAFDTWTWVRQQIQLKSNNNNPGGIIPGPLDMCVSENPGVFEGEAPFYVTGILPINQAFLTGRTYGESNRAIVRLPEVGFVNLRITGGAAGYMHLVGI